MNKKNACCFIFLFSLFIAVSFVTASCQSKIPSPNETPKPAESVDNSLRLGETRETLPPSMFSDPFVAETYQIAKDIPHVLDSVKCYCLCDRMPFNHKSLLSCFVDHHAEG